MITEEYIAEIILKELYRQEDESRCQLYVSQKRLRETTIDGVVDLKALAKAIYDAAVDYER